ncbi:MULTISPECIES: hypothetical protein [unclassified Streptomyces]|uniref:hypothetical protein n=1 Tax=unclassified Streptomyces TaxID=2593676 RepID=UPI002250B10F|nr:MULTISPECIES: hypothetical protein [unclassified Streptomyces]MCX4990055.1 hypothetical protein [Streptomyces sp. NBC_00568]MCX5004715.1 hypothetical protein [Streptomyces sp. NBC_00638]
MKESEWVEIGVGITLIGIEQELQGAFGVLGLLGFLLLTIGLRAVNTTLAYAGALVLIMLTVQA